MWTLAKLLRLAHSDACAELSDLARSSAITYADNFGRGGELVELAYRLVRDAEDVLLLAVAAERAQGVSWEAIGEGLGGVSKQAAQKRFSERVEQLELDVLLPLRHQAIRDARMTHTAGPDAVVDPDATLARLDAWAERHHERSDGGKDVINRLVSHGLRERPARALDHMGVVTKLAALLMDATGSFASRELPDGLTERDVRSRLIEAKIALYDAMLAESTAGDATARTEGARAFEDLVALRTEETRERLAIRWTTDDEASIALGERVVAVLSRTPGRGADVRGWWLCGVDEDGHADDRGGAWPQLVDEDLDVEREQLEHAALEAIAGTIGSDQAKGIEPFGPGGIAGPDATMSR